MGSKKIKILAVDDNQDNLTSLKAIINDIFPEAVTLTAMNGTRGIELAKAEAPDVILLDIVMPGMDGFEVCQKLKADKDLRDIPVVFVTAIKGDQESRIRALECGAEAFLAKPIERSELTAQIRAMVKIKVANIEKLAEKERLATRVREQTLQLETTHRATLNLLEDLKKENEARKQSEKTIKGLIERLSLSLKTANAGTWDWDIQNNTFFWSEEFLVLFGMEPDTVPGFESFTKSLHPDDVEIASKRIQDAIDERADLVQEYRIILPGGELKWIRATGQVTYQNATPIRMVGLCMDISKQKQAEEVLKESELKYRSLIESSSDAIFCVDEKGEYKFTNQIFASTFGKTPEYFVGKTFWDIYDKEHADYRYEATQRLFKTGLSESIEVEVPLPDKTLYFLATTNPIKDESGKVILNLTHATNISELKGIEHELVKAKEHAEESDRLKSAFLANMSHEIRTPMNGILGFAELLKEPDLTGPEHDTYISIIEKSGVRLLNIINDIVSISKIESGQMGIAVSEVNINEKIEFLCDFFNPEATQKGLELVFSQPLPKSKAMVRTDPEKVIAVLTNLMKNALKFTQHGSVKIGCNIVETDNHPSVRIFVKDTGIGISQDEQKIIFERFRQGTDLLNRKYEGTGLGLSISKAYAEMLGGKLWVESEAGKGSTFYLIIPVQSSQRVSP